MVMIERLVDKPEDKTVEVWLHEVAKDTVLWPIRREEWIILSGSKALKVVNNGSETTYAVHGSSTIAIRYDRPVKVVNQIVSAFKFQHRK